MISIFFLVGSFWLGVAVGALVHWFADRRKEDALKLCHDAIFEFLESCHQPGDNYVVGKERQSLIDAESAARKILLPGAGRDNQTKPTAAPAGDGAEN